MLCPPTAATGFLAYLACRKVMCCLYQCTRVLMCPVPHLSRARRSLLIPPNRAVERRLREAGLDVPARLLSREEAWGLAHASEQHAAVDGEMVDEEADWRPAEPLHVREAHARAERRARRAVRPRTMHQWRMMHECPRQLWQVE